MAESATLPAVGWIGTGVMGAHMAMHVLKSGKARSLTVYNRTASKAQRLVDAGAALKSTPAEVGAECDIIFTMVGYPSDVRSVIASETGVLSTLRKGGIVVDLTTSEPGLAAELAALASKSGKYVVDAPVTGGDIGAQKGTLSVMVGGDKSAVDTVLPLIETFASTVNHFGAAGLGQHCKMANQITIACSMLGMCEGLMYAHAAGLDLDTYIAAIRGGGAGSFSIESYAPRILKNDMEPGFYVEHFVKDLGIAINACREMGVSLPGLALAQQLYVSLCAHGDGKMGTQALIITLERLNNRKMPGSNLVK